MNETDTLENDLLLRALRGEPVERVPVWVMRQAGRYLPEYRALRSRHEFFTICRTPDLAAEVTLQPIERFPLDAAIIFSDILVVPQALGLEVEMVSGTGPRFPRPLEDPADLDRLRSPGDSFDHLDYVLEAIRVTCRRLEDRIPLIGFTGAPWTLMAYMVDGGGDRSFPRAKRWLFDHPEASDDLLRRISEAVAELLIGQADAGARVLQVFDSWAGIVDPHTYEHRIFPHLERVADRVRAVHPDLPLVVFPKGAPEAVEPLSATAFDAVSIDWTVSPRRMRRAVAGRAALQGNLDPDVLYARPEVIRSEVDRMLEEFGSRSYVANLGHGMRPDHDPDRLAVFVDRVQSYSRRLATVESQS